MSLSNLAWAMDQRCETPLQKLILMYLADAIGEEGRWQVSIAKLEEFCCAASRDVAEAVLDLDEADKLQIFGCIEDKLDVAFPWWKPQVTRPFKEPDPTIIRYTRKQLWDDQGGGCWYCGCEIHADPRLEPFCQIEHQHPRSRGGRSSRENIVLACRPCNIRKKDKTVEEFRVWLEQRNGAAVVFHGEGK